MEFFRRFFGGRNTEADIGSHDADLTQVKVPAPVSTRDENAVLADDPVAFSKWIFQCLVETMTDEKAKSLCAPEEVALKLGITDVEQLAAVNEFVLMQALGACIFTGLNLSLEDRQKFKRDMGV